LDVFLPVLYVSRQQQIADFCKSDAFLKYKEKAEKLQTVEKALISSNLVHSFWTSKSDKWNSDLKETYNPFAVKGCLMRLEGVIIAPALKLSLNQSDYRTASPKTVEQSMAVISEAIDYFIDRVNMETKVSGDDPEETKDLDDTIAKEIQFWVSKTPGISQIALETSLTTATSLRLLYLTLIASCMSFAAFNAQVQEHFKEEFETFKKEIESETQDFELQRLFLTQCRAPIFGENELPQVEEDDVQIIAEAEIVEVVASPGQVVESVAEAELVEVKASPDSIAASEV
jgi:hypothetical protein